ncbi:MAG: D-glucuronyl C5-epimerase family protein [Candidatus Helarchaeota archaeon]
MDMNDLNKDYIYEKIQSIKSWILTSGIQCIEEGQDCILGSFQCWYDLSKKNYPFAYSEITGYGITALLFLNTIDPDPSLIDRAILAGDFLINNAQISRKGTFNDRYLYHKERFRPWLFAFDNAMCLNGFVNLFKLTKNIKYLKMATKLGDWLVDSMQKEDGSFFAVYDADNKIYIDGYGKWSTQSEPFHTKNAIGLLNLYDVTNEEKYKNSAIDVCDWAMNLQKDDGRFVNFTRLGYTHTHPLIYTVEGLFCSGMLLENKKYIESGRKAVEWILKNQFENGGFPAWYKNGEFLPDERADAVAQVIRMWLLYSYLENTKFRAGNLIKAITHLLSYQCKDEDPRAKNGIIFGCNDMGEKKIHVNSAATMFTIQALYYYYLNLIKNFKFNPYLLI